MNQFRTRLKEARQTNVDGDWYISRLAIDELTNHNTISQINLEKNSISGEKADPIFRKVLRPSNEQVILRQAKVTFTILCYAVPACVPHIIELIDYAVRRGTEIDNCLPLSKIVLCGCGLQDEHSEVFCSTQWHFIAPKIRLGNFVPNDFGQEVVLPLRRNRVEPRSLPDTGAFGTVIEVCVEQGHQVEPAYSGRVNSLTLFSINCLSVDDEQIVRKQFHHEKSKDSFLRELRNLCILSSAKHENIVQLLGAYIHKNSFNLIFPLASHGNLDQLFHSDSSSSSNVMKSDESVAMALCGLASALVTMHEFTTENIRLIGCHRDLKPANILIDDRRFLLADFGLSRIVDSQGTSSSTAPNVAGDFIAPEHEDKDRDFDRNPIGRSSDIWAFGCITLMLLVFLQDRKHGLDHLESKRRVEWPQYAHHCFHDYDKPNLGLEEPFQKLASSQSAYTRGLLYLVKSILVLEPMMRPKATAVDAHIRCLILYVCSMLVEEEFAKACKKNDYIHMHFERARFRGWRSAAKVSESDFPNFQGDSARRILRVFDTVVTHLKELQRMLAGFSDGSINHGSKTFLPVKSRIDRLIQSLDDADQITALVHTESIILESEKLLWFKDLERLSKETFDRRTENKVAIRRERLRSSNSKALYVSFDSMEPSPNIIGLSKVRLSSNTSRESDLAFAEEAHAFDRYQTTSAPYDVQGTLSRLQERANLISTCRDNELFKVLRCRGYYHHPTQLRSGLLYELPMGPDGRLEKFITLNDILKSTDSKWCLGDRFNLAYGLANSMYELHSVAWLHRNISASNIVFFYDGTTDTVDPNSFRFVGFAQSRANRDLTNSDGPMPRMNDEDYYQHPEYLSHAQGYDFHHDYYALGVLLLEIGFWKLFPDLVRAEQVDYEAGTLAMNELVPQLDWVTGTKYRDAVIACLDGTFGSTSLLQQGLKLPLIFRSKVVDQLSSSHCRA